MQSCIYIYCELNSTIMLKQESHISREGGPEALDDFRILEFSLLLNFSVFHKNLSPFYNNKR